MNLIFSYGTLIDKFPQEKIEIELNDCFRLSNYGQYPALIKDDREHSIQGYLVSLTDKEFKKADYYEGYPDLYNRVERNIIHQGKTIKVWVYVLDEKDESKKSNIDVKEYLKNMKKGFNL